MLRVWPPPPHLPASRARLECLSLRIAAITRMTTQNAGNEALSVGLLDFLSQQSAPTEVRALDRYPRRLETLTLGRGDPAAAVAQFEATARQILTWAAPLHALPIAPVADARQVQLNTTARELPEGALRAFKRRLGLRRNLARLGLIGRADFQVALNTLNWADLVVWNPAGEYHPTGDVNQPYRLLLMVRVAQLLGKKTAVVNHSLELENDNLEAVVAHVYVKADLITVRDAPSLQIARDMGVDAGRVAEAPDLVFLSAHPGRTRPAPDAPIGLSINGLQALAGHDEWPAFMEGLVALRRPLIFVSNAMNHDMAFARSLAARWPIEILDNQPTHTELREIYGRCALLISSRLHASILAIGAGTPVVSIEPQVFKLTAIFDQLDYPIATENLKTLHWADRTLAKVCAALAQRDQIAADGRAGIERQVGRVRAAYAPLFAPSAASG